MWAEGMPLDSKTMGTIDDHGEFSQLLVDVRSGEGKATDRLFEMVHAELGRLAAVVFSGQRPGHTLQPTALVNEAWLKLAGGLGAVEDRHHFFALAAQSMRQILADHARGRGRRKRGGGQRRVTLSTGALAGVEDALDLVAFHDALSTLAELNPRHAEVVELRVLGALTIPEIAGRLGASPATIKRDWSVARLWLLRELRGA